MFKKIAVFTAFSFISVALSNPDISKLQAEILQKEKALSELGKKIEEKERLIIKMLRSISKIYKYLDSEASKKMHEEVSAFLQRFSECPTSNFNNILTKEFFSDESDWIFSERIKSLTIRMIIEKELLKELIRQYENQLQEVVTLEDQLEKSEQQT